jgi:formylglycine-generating enzyme required for sulfatase activity
LVGELARSIRDHWLGEFETILKGEQGPDRQRAACEFQSDFLTIPAGKVTMGNPTGKRIPSADSLEIWRGLFREAIKANSQQWIEQWIDREDGNGFFGCGPSRDDQIASYRQLWTSALMEHQSNGRGFAVIENALFGQENETWLTDLLVPSFDFGRSPVLNEWYRLFVPDHGLDGTPWAEDYKDFSRTPRHPAIYISFYDAWAFCLWAHFAGASCRLPWEREWEYVAKLGVKPEWHYWWHETRFDEDKATAFQRNRKPETSPPSPDHASPATKALDRGGRGIMDQLGNVWEWCQDHYAETAWNIPEGPPGNPADTPGQPDQSRVLRAGSFNSSPDICRASFRLRRRPSLIIDYNGFRAARACSPR